MNLNISQSSKWILQYTGIRLRQFSRIPIFFRKQQPDSGEEKEADFIVLSRAGRPVPSGGP